MVRIELELTDEINDEIVLESLKWHLNHSKSHKPTVHESKEEYKKIQDALQIVVEYYGGD